MGQPVDPLGRERKRRLILELVQLLDEAEEFDEGYLVVLLTGLREELEDMRAEDARQN